MFTGIIEEVGNVQKISRQQQALALTISAKKVLEDVRAKKRTVSNAVYIDLRMDAELTHYCIPKGSITIDGTSLTIFDVRENGITVSLIPHTYAETIFSKKREGAIVNVENDVIAKYVEKLTAKQKPLTRDFLAHHGY